MKYITQVAHRVPLILQHTNEDNVAITIRLSRKKRRQMRIWKRNDANGYDLLPESEWHIFKEREQS